MSLALATASELVSLAEIESPETVVHRSATACCCERATAFLKTYGRVTA